MNVAEKNALDLHGVSTDREKLLTPGDVAKWLCVSPAWVRDHATRKQPHLPAVKLGKLLRFRPVDVEKFIESWCK